MIKIDFEHKMARSFGFQLFLVLTNIYLAGEKLIIIKSIIFSV